MAVFLVMLKIYEQVSWNFNWYVSPYNLAKVHIIFLNLTLDFILQFSCIPLSNFIPEIEHFYVYINFSLNSATETRYKKSNVVCDFRLVSNEETWLALLSWVSKNPRFTTLNVMRHKISLDNLHVTLWENLYEKNHTNKSINKKQRVIG